MFKSQSRIMKFTEQSSERLFTIAESDNGGLLSPEPMRVRSFSKVLNSLEENRGMLDSPNDVIDSLI